MWHIRSLRNLRSKLRPDKNAGKSGKRRGRPMDVREFHLLPINNLKDDDTIKQMQLEIGPAAIVPSLGPASPAPSIGPPSPLPNSRSSAPSPAVVDTSSSEESGLYCSISEPGYQPKRMRPDSPRPSPFKMFRLARPQNKTSFI